MSPTKQAKSQGNSGKQKLHQVTEWKKKTTKKPSPLQYLYLGYTWKAPNAII